MTKEEHQQNGSGDSCNLSFPHRNIRQLKETARMNLPKLWKMVKRLQQPSESRLK